MGVIDSILGNPSAWTGQRVLDELPVRMYDDDRLDDRSVPWWLRAMIILLDVDAHVQMEGLLGWWENAASDDLDDVMAAFHAVGLADQAPYTVSSFAERHEGFTEERCGGAAPPQRGRRP